MIDLARDGNSSITTRPGTQPIVLAAATLLVILAGAACIALWRAYGGMSPEPDPTVAIRQLQARAARTSEQLVEKAKDLEITQQDSIDQLQMVQDQLRETRKQLSAQQVDTKQLSEQVATLAEAVDGLRQSFASVQPVESSRPSTPRRNSRAHIHPAKAEDQKPAKSGG